VSDVAALALGVLAGAGTQRVTGLGFALVSSPLLVLVLGPYQGVLLANVLSLAANLAVLAMTWRDVEVSRALRLALPALLLVPVGAWVARRLPASVLMVVIGLLVVAALGAMLVSSRARVFRGTGGAVAAGALSGFMNVTAGVGGPAITMYAVSTDWDHRTFVPTMQLYFALLNAGSIAAKGLPTVGLVQAVVAGLALGLGLLGGQLLAGRVRPHRARQAVVILALLGAAATVVKGAWTW
jgi:uncharacterized protein